MSDKEDPRCPVCYSRYLDEEHTPKIFPTCGHTICKKCLHKVLNNYTPKCPLDQLPLSRELKSVDSFPTNFIAQKLVKNNWNYPRCSKHPEEREKVICMTDKKLICTDCVLLGDHKDHEIRPLTEAQKCAQAKENQLKGILDKIKANVSQFDKSIQEKEMNIKEAIKKRFNSLYEAIKKHETQMLSELETMLREEKARARNPRLRDRAEEAEHNLWALSQMVSSPQFVMSTTREILKILEEDFTKLEKTMDKEFMIASQKIEEFSSLLTVFENSIPREDLLKELSIGALEKNLAEWNKQRKSPSEEEAQEVIISSDICLSYPNDKFLNISKGNYYSKPTEDFTYDKSKLAEIKTVEYCISLSRPEKEEETIIPALHKLSKYLPNVKWVWIHFEICNGSRIYESNERLHGILSAAFSHPENFEKLEFTFTQHKLGELGFIFLAEEGLPKIKNLTNFSMITKETRVSHKALNALAQVNWKVWPNLKKFRLDIPEPTFEEGDILKFLNGIPNVSELAIGFGNTQLTDESLENFSTNVLPSLDKLEKFEIGLWNTKLTSAGAEKFLMNLPNVKRILIGLTRTGITEDVIKRFLENKLPLLTELKEFRFRVSEENLSKETVQQIREWEEKEYFDDFGYRPTHFKTWKDPEAPERKRSEWRKNTTKLPF